MSKDGYSSFGYAIVQAGISGACNYWVSLLEELVGGRSTFHMHIVLYRSRLGGCERKKPKLLVGVPTLSVPTLVNLWMAVQKACPKIFP